MNLWRASIAVFLVALGASAFPGCARSRCCPCVPPAGRAMEAVSRGAEAEPEAPPPVKTEKPVAEPVTEPRDAWPASFETAHEDLEMLKSLRGPRVINDELLQYMDAVFHAYANLRPPVEADAAERAAFENHLARYRREAEKHFLRCLALTKVVEGRNIREDVNILAAMKLGKAAPYLDERERERLSRRIERAIDRDFTRAESPALSQDVLDRSFEALARLNAMRALEWILDDYVHAKLAETPFLTAAHEALLLFEDVPGKQRYEIVREFLKTYAGVEAQAAQSSTDPAIQAAGRLWDHVGPGAVAVAQHFAGGPTDEIGRPLSTMKDLQVWYRAHKNPRRPPWVDEDASR